MKVVNFILASFCLFAAVFNPMYIQAEERFTYTEDGLIEEAFITYATDNYFPLVEALLDSIEVFSTRPIVVFGINADVPFSTEKYPFMIKKRIDIESSTRESVFFTKPRVILESGVQRGIYVDADIILNKGFDVLFEHCKKEVDYPLCPTFPWEVNNQQPVMEVLGIKEKSMQYVHAPLIIFSDKCIPFVEEWRQTNWEYGHLATCHDETILNVLLWKYGVNDFINLCDPYYALAYDYLDGGTHQHHIHGYGNWIGRIDFLTFHGCKNGGEAKYILNRLIEKHKDSE